MREPRRAARRPGRPDFRAVRVAGSRAGLGVLVALAALAPWLGLHDPAAQPDSLVLGGRPPGARVVLVRLAEGGRIHADEAVLEPQGSVRFRRGGAWRAIEAERLAAPPLTVERRWLGTDDFGRDLASRLLHGARASLGVGLAAALLAMLGGAAVGLAAALGPPAVDSALMRLTDLALAVPRLFLALLLVGLWGPGWATTIVVVAGTTWMAAARMVRGEALSLRERPFVAAARAAGASPLRVAAAHLLPGVAGPLGVEGLLRVADAILLEAALSFLGLGVPPPAPSWGNLVAEGRGALLDAWWVSTFPGLAIALTVVLLHAATDGLGRRHRTGRSAASTSQRQPARSSASRAAA